jgi:hypothetical protein
LKLIAYKLFVADAEHSTPSDFQNVIYFSGVGQNLAGVSRHLSIGWRKVW